MPERPEGAGPVPPREPPPARWALPDPRLTDGDLVALGADLEPETLLAAYRQGFFPMRVEADGPIGWWSPDPRGVIPLEGWHATRSLRRSARRYDVTVDAAFPEVVAGCADPARPHGWIDDSFRAAYGRLHELGWAHSIEVWTTDESPARLAGGLYGVAVGGLFAGESMFHRARDASKVALLTLVEALPAAGGVLFDVQWSTPHLATLGAVALPRDEYLRRLADALRRPTLRLEL